MRIILDTANLDDIRYFNEYFPIEGVTTNPTILSKEGGDVLKLLKDIRAIIGDKELHVQVTETDADKMVEEAEAIVNYLGKNTFVKIPATPAGLKATRILSAKGIGITVTAVLTAAQAMLASNAGAAYVAPYVSRLENICADGVGTVAEIVTGCNRAIKGYASRRKEIPTRIDELSRTARSYKDGDSQEEVKRLEEKAVIARGDIATFDKEIEYLAKANEDAIAAEFDLVQIKNKLNADYRAKKEALDRKIRAAQSDKARVESVLKATEGNLANARSKEVRLKAEVARCEANITTCNARAFKFDEYNPSKYVEPFEEVCPHCGRPYDTESIVVAKANAEEAGRRKYESELKYARERFWADKKSLLGHAKSDLEYTEGAYDAALSDVKHYEKEAKAARKQLATVDKALTALIAERNALVEPDVEANEEVIAMKAEINRLHGEVEKSKALSDKRYEAQNILDNLRRNRENMVLRMSSVDTYNKQLEARKAELEAELADLTKKEMAETRKRDLVKAFELAKIKAVTDKLNSRFKYVKWQMFAEQVNGGYADVCIPTVEGTSYDGLLNHGKKLLAELDIALAFQNFYGVKLPLILDDAESVDVERIPKVDRQLIVLRREGEKGTPLTVEVGKWE